MASSTKTASNLDGSTKTTATYSCDTSGFGYSIITDDIRKDFDFLISALPNKLDEVMSEINSSAKISDAFLIENGSSFNDLSIVRDELQKDINTLKTELSTLHSAFMTDIDNINMELEYNFGWIVIGKVKGSQRTETVETNTKNS